MNTYNTSNEFYKNSMIYKMSFCLHGKTSMRDGNLYKMQKCQSVLCSAPVDRFFVNYLCVTKREGENERERMKHLSSQNIKFQERDNKLC